MRGYIDELHITVALPASGKTTWSKAKVDSNRNHNIRHIDCDYLRNFWGGDSMESLIESQLYYSDKVTIVDGLFLTQDDVIKLLSIFRDKKYQINKVFIQWWKPNREKCLWNDLYRRNKNSITTIENGVIDNFDDISKITEEYPDIKFKVVKHEIVMKKKYRVFADKYDLSVNENGEHMGTSWSLGGSWANCWGDSGSVSGEAQPEGMPELDELLEKVCPDISFLQYKNIMGRCVHTIEYNEGNYYGGSVTYAQYVLNVETLYNTLVEKELIEPITE